MLGRPSTLALAFAPASIALRLCLAGSRAGSAAAASGRFVWIYAPHGTNHPRRTPVREVTKRRQRPQRLSRLAFRGMEGDRRGWTANERWGYELAESLVSTGVESTTAAG